MTPEEIIRGKRVLIVDDEPDVLQTLCEILEDCKIDTAETFAHGQAMLKQNIYDIAILDIMGVNGFGLLETAYEIGIPAIILTAHALSESSLETSVEKGACYFVPKEHMGGIVTYIADILDAVQKGKNPWLKCIERMGRVFDRRFGGKNWRDKEKNFWEQKTKKLL